MYVYASICRCQTKLLRERDTQVQLRMISWCSQWCKDDFVISSRKQIATSPRLQRMRDGEGTKDWISVPIQRVKSFNISSVSKFMTYLDLSTPVMTLFCLEKPVRSTIMLYMQSYDDLPTLNLQSPQKNVFHSDSLTFFGLVFSAHGVSPNPAKVKATQDC